MIEIKQTSLTSWDVSLTNGRTLLSSRREDEIPSLVVEFEAVGITVTVIPFPAPSTLLPPPSIQKQQAEIKTLVDAIGDKF